MFTTFEEIDVSLQKVFNLILIRVTKVLFGLCTESCSYRRT